MALPIERFVQMCFHGVFCHVVEKALIVEPEEPKPIQILRKDYSIFSKVKLLVLHAIHMGLISLIVYGISLYCYQCTKIE